MGVHKFKWGSLDYHIVLLQVLFFSIKLIMFLDALPNIQIPHC